VAVKSNPIRRLRSVYTPPARPGGIGMVDVGYWYAICPVCDEKIVGKGEWVSSRKIAKDKLYQHTKKNHAGPGGSSTSLSA
jgi:hypothetical protein